MNAHDAERFETALTSADAAGQLLELARQMKRENLSQVEIYCRFEERLKPTLGATDERDYNSLTDVMDCIVGFCAMDAALFSHHLTHGEIERYRSSEAIAGAQTS